MRDILPRTKKRRHAISALEWFAIAAAYAVILLVCWR